MALDPNTPQGAVFYMTFIGKSRNGGGRNGGGRNGGNAGCGGCGCALAAILLVVLVETAVRGLVQ